MHTKYLPDYMHTAVNPLAGEEHLKEVIQQLQLMGEVSMMRMIMVLVVIMMFITMMMMMMMLSVFMILMMVS